jgi:glycosyltransferase involved in cell wall biosynthesis
LAATADAGRVGERRTEVLNEARRGDAATGAFGDPPHAGEVWPQQAGATAKPVDLNAVLACSVRRAADQTRNGGSGVPRVSVLIPTLNEAPNLPHVLPALPDGVDELVLVDGHSTDETLEIARTLCPDVQVVLAEKKGKGAALLSGLAECTGDIVIMLDADGSNDPAEIPRFVGALVSGADYAKGSRFLTGGGTTDMPFYRKLGNRVFVWLVRLFFGSRYTDLCYGYNAFWRHVVDELRLDCDGFEIETMMNIRALRAGLRIVEVPSFESERIHGSSNLKTISDGWKVLKTILAERFRRVRVEPRPREVAPYNADYEASFGSD